MTPAEVNMMIASKLGRTTADDDRLNNGAAALSLIADNSRLSEFLQAIRDDSSGINQCAAMSYRHPLGFDKMMLIDATPSFLLRLHAWWPGSQPEVEARGC